MLEEKKLCEDYAHDVTVGAHRGFMPCVRALNHSMDERAVIFLSNCIIMIDIYYLWLSHGYSPHLANFHFLRTPPNFLMLGSCEVTCELWL